MKNTHTNIILTEWINDENYVNSKMLGCLFDIGIENCIFIQ